MCLKGRASMCAALDMLELDNLSEQHNKSRYALFLVILSNEECHEALTYSYDELMNTGSPDMGVTRAVSMGEPQTILQDRQPITTASCPVQYGK